MYVTAKEDGGTSFIVTGVMPDTKRIVLAELRGKPLAAYQTVMTTPLANKLGVKPGGTIAVVSDENLQEYAFTVDAIAGTCAGEFIFVPLERLNALEGLPAVSYIGIWGDEPLSFPVQEIRSTNSMDVVIAVIDNQIGQTGVTVYGLTVAAVVLGLLIIFVVNSMMVEENGCGISLMKAFGYRSREITRLVLWAAIRHWWSQAMCWAFPHCSHPSMRCFER